MEAGKAAALGLTCLARWAGSAAAGVEPTLMGLGPVEAVGRLLKRRKLACSDIDLFEINEAFAAQALACARLLEIDPDRLNVLGGAIALGHPWVPAARESRLLCCMRCAAGVRDAEWPAYASESAKV
jgi:acetyl-CoA acetyltransferase